jgi:hypothetical protein
MGLENPNVIDVAGMERDGSAIVLTIADAWDWSDEPSHLVALQRKLDAYLAFIETGQVFEVYPEAEGRLVVIDVVASVPAAAAGLELLHLAHVVAKELGASVTHRVLPVGAVGRDGLN